MICAPEPHCFMKKLLLLFLILKGLHTQACSCNYEFSEFTPAYLHSYDRIVACKPLSVDTLNYTLRYKALVLRTYWGRKQDTVTIVTARQGSMCGAPLDLQQLYLIYGSGDSLIAINSYGPSRELSVDRLDFLTERDSVRVPINGVFRTCTVPFLKHYYRQKDSVEIAILEELLSHPKGKLVTHFVNGKESGTISLQNAKLSGPATFYYPDGKLLASGNFIANAKEGTWTECIYKEIRGKAYYISRTGNYAGNKRRGQWKGKMLSGNFKDFSHDYLGTELSPNYD